jgi:hypothetical protein
MIVRKIGLTSDQYVKTNGQANTCKYEKSHIKVHIILLKVYDTTHENFRLRCREKQKFNDSVKINVKTAQQLL